MPASWSFTEDLGQACEARERPCQAPGSQGSRRPYSQLDEVLGTQSWQSGKESERLRRTWPGNSRRLWVFSIRYSERGTCFWVPDQTVSPAWANVVRGRRIEWTSAGPCRGLAPERGSRPGLDDPAIALGPGHGCSGLRGLPGHPRRATGTRRSPVTQPLESFRSPAWGPACPDRALRAWGQKLVSEMQSIHETHVFPVALAAVKRGRERADGHRPADSADADLRFSDQVSGAGDQRLQDINGRGCRGLGSLGGPRARRGKRRHRGPQPSAYRSFLLQVQPNPPAWSTR